MIILNKEELMLYKDSLLVALAPHDRHSLLKMEDILSRIYTCIMKRKFSGTVQEKVNIANMAKKELETLYKSIA